MQACRDPRVEEKAKKKCANRLFIVCAIECWALGCFVLCVRVGSFLLSCYFNKRALIKPTKQRESEPVVVGRVNVPNT